MLTEYEEKDFLSCTREDTYRKLDFLGFTMCPLKHTFREALDQFLSIYKEETGEDFDCLVPAGCGGGDYDNIWQAEDIDDFPDVVASLGFGNFFRKSFVERFVDKGYFRPINKGVINKSFAGKGFLDTEKGYTLYAVVPYVMLIDKKKLGDLPIPRIWRDLLRPEYSNNIIVGGSAGKVSDVLLLYLHKEYGDKALEMLAPNIKDVWHAAKMAKTAGNNSDEGAAIYVLPWFFAKSCPRTDGSVSVLWPEDGAITSPFYLLIKKDAAQKLKPVTDFVTGEVYGKKSATSFFPVFHPSVDNRLPSNATLKWLGWDYINANHMDELKDQIQAIFQKYWQR